MELGMGGLGLDGIGSLRRQPLWNQRPSITSLIASKQHRTQVRDIPAVASLSFAVEGLFYLKDQMTVNSNYTNIL